jgi:GNAT superfamily N-acetyltransferase
VDPRASLELNRLEIRQLTPEDVGLLAEFSCGGDEGERDLNEFLRDDALRFQERNIVRVYLAFYDGTLQGYIALLADSVRLKTKERRKIELLRDDPINVPALKVGRLAVCKAFRSQVRGLGAALLQFAYISAVNMAEAVGCRFLTVDAYPTALGFYETHDFVPNLDNAYADLRNISMRLDVHQPELPKWFLVPPTAHLSAETVTPTAILDDALEQPALALGKN